MTSATVVDFEVGELVATALATHLRRSPAHVSAQAIDLDGLVEQAEQTLAARARRAERPWHGIALPAPAPDTPAGAPRGRTRRPRRAGRARRLPQARRA